MSTVNKNKKLYEEIIADVKSVAATAPVDAEFTLKTYLTHGGKFTEWTLRKFGGFKSVAFDAFGAEERPVAVLRGQENRKNYVRNLEQVAGDKEYFADKIKEALVVAFTKNPVVISNIKHAPFTPKRHQRENVALISDVHFGLTIDKNEVMCNEYNWTVASRRMAKFAEQIATYKSEHRKEGQQLRLCLGGDLAQGIIHLSDSGTALLTEQLHGTLWILTKFIDYLRHHYKRIVIECTPDNHLRMVHKGGSRAVSQKWDSYATMIHMGLQLAFRNAPDVVINVPKTPFTTFKVFEHSFFLTHGDTVLSSGNVGRAINVGAITNKVRALQASGVPIDVVLMGHVHVPLNTTLDNGTELVVNGTGSGTDSYAQSIGYMNSNPCQVLFESTPEYAVGDFRKVYLKDADLNTRLDSIIPPYNPATPALVCP